MAEGLLDGVRILEMSHVMAAPSGGLLLADMGADVIKVERLPEGDEVRRSGPFLDGNSAPFAMMNRNKRGIAIDMKSDAGRATLRRLMEGADVFVENYRTGAMTHYGLGYEQVKADMPRLIYCSVSGFGQTGPYAERGGFDLVAQGMSGLMSFTGEGPGREPVKVGAPLTDITAGALAALGILGALLKRATSGRGQLVDTSLFEAGIMHTYWQSAIHLAGGGIAQAMGSAHPLYAPYQAFRTSDGWIIVGAANHKLWCQFVEVIGRPELAEDERFREVAGRLANLDALVAELTRTTETFTSAQLQDMLLTAGVPAGPVLDVAQMAADEQTRARGMIRQAGGTEDTPMRVIGHPVKYSDAETPIRRAAPRLGQHTAEVLAEAGFEAGEIDALEEDGAILVEKM
jgi:crotonobetainyl-CoA:carnitine CoA-transferase CaiB-like acyl-CoA transferase